MNLSFPDDLAAMENMNETSKRSNDFQYDFYLCHHEEDEEKAIKILEHFESDGVFKGFFDRRDSQGNLSDIKNLEGITRSRQVLLLLSKTFLKSKWFEYCMHTTLQHCLSSERIKTKVIPIYIGISYHDLPLELKTITGLSYNDDLNSPFWKKIRQALNES